MIYQKFDKRILWVCAFITLGLAGFIARQSLAPAQSMPSITHMDKIVHCGAYCVLGFFALPAFALFPFAWAKPIWAWLGLVSFGILIEILQGLMSAGRSADALDALANSTGALMAVITWACISWVWRRVFTKPILSGEMTP